MNLAVLQERNNDFVDAEQNLKKALALDPKSAPAALAAGQLYESQKRWQEAEQQFQAAIGLEPGNPAMRATLARLYLSEGRKDLAEQSLRDAKNSAALKDNPAGYRLLGDFYLSQGELDEASAEFASLYTAHPTDLVVARGYAGILILQNHIDDAAKVDDAILKSFPADYEAQVLHGQILTRQGKPNDAIPVLEAAVKSAPDNAAGHYYLGLAYAAVSNFGQAQYHWLEAARLRPDMPEPERAIAAYAAQSGNAALLLDSSEQLIKIEPRFPEGYLYHASAVYSKGRSGWRGTRFEKGHGNCPSEPGCVRAHGRLAFDAKAVRRSRQTL